MIKKNTLLIIFLSGSLMGFAQDTALVKLDVGRIKWLFGTWEGTGYRSEQYMKRLTGQRKNMPLNFVFEFHSDSLMLILKCEREVILREQLNLESEYTRFDWPKVASMFGLSIYLWHPEAKWENRLLMISPVNDDNFNLLLVYYRKTGKEALIAHGAFKRIR